MKIQEKFYFILFTLFAYIFLLSQANAQQSQRDRGKYGGTLRIAIAQDFKSLDARYLAQSGTSSRGQHQLYNRLVEFGPQGTHDIVPSLATDWKRIDDVTWLVTLRRGVRFHNGKKLTADDIVKNFDWRINRNKYAQEKGWRPPRGRNYYMQIQKIEADDNYTLRFTLKHPFVPFVKVNLGWGFRGIIDPDVVEKYERQATRHPVGTGPFKYAEYVSGSHLLLERFDEYWGGRSYLDRVLFRIIPDAQTRMIALQKGEVDIATDLLFSQIGELEKDPRITYHLITEARRGSWGNLWFNFRRWPMNQLKFRQAVAMGADWKFIGKAIFPKSLSTPPVRYTLYERSWLENEAAKKLIPSYNPDKAKRLLKEVEKEAGKPIPRIYGLTNRGHQGIPGAALRIGAEQLKNIGLQLDVHILEPEVSKDKIRRDPKCEWDVEIGSFVGPAMDPSETVSDFHSKTVVTGDGKNIPAYSNPQVDELIRKGAAAYDVEERKKIYQEIETIILKDLVLLPLFDIPFVFGYNKKVHDFPAHDSAHPLFFTTWNNVWLEK